jgi:hypothetical protein
MPWDKPKFSNAANFTTGDSEKKIAVTYRMEVEKFPVASFDLTEIPTDASPTYTIGWEYSIDGDNWELLYQVTGQNNGATDIVDLSSEPSSKPSGAPYLRAFATPSGALGAAQSADVVFKHSWWVEEEQTGARVI